MNNKLSIAIPTYNRKDIIYNNIKHLLTMKSKNIEVIVVDNNSTDGTYEKLLSINDSRLKVFKNNVNIGFTKNYYRAIEESSTNFVFVVSDEDIVNLEFIEAFLNDIYYRNSILENKIGAIIFNQETFGCLIKDKIKKIFSSASYMSGIMINKKILQKIEYINEDTLYPHIWILAKLSNISEIFISKHKFYTKGDMGKESYIETYLRPIDRYNQFVQSLSLIKEININQDEKMDISIMFYKDNFLNMTIYNTLIRCESYLKYYKLNDEDIYIDYEYYIKLFNDKFLEHMKLEFKNIDTYSVKTFILNLNESVLSVINARLKFDELKANGYKSCLLSDTYRCDINKMHKFKFDVDYINENNKVDKDDKVVFIADCNNNYDFNNFNIKKYEIINIAELLLHVDFLYEQSIYM